MEMRLWMEAAGTLLLLGQDRSHSSGGGVDFDDEGPIGVRMYQEWSGSESLFERVEGLWQGDLGGRGLGQRLGLITEETGEWVGDGAVVLDETAVEIALSVPPGNYQDHFRPEPRLPLTPLTLLSGKAALLGTAVWEYQHPCCASFHLLSEEMKRVFDRAATGREAAHRLPELRQGSSSVTEYSIEFRTLAAECQWNEAAQWDRFLHGLSDRVQQEIYLLELPLLSTNLLIWRCE